MIDFSSLSLLLLIIAYEKTAVGRLYSGGIRIYHPARCYDFRHLAGFLFCRKVRPVAVSPDVSIRISDIAQTGKICYSILNVFILENITEYQAV